MATDPEPGGLLKGPLRLEFRTAAILLAALTLVVFAPSLTGDRLVGGADVVRSAYPIRYHFWSIIHRGEWPTWTPYLMGGYPILVEEQASLFYPPEWLFGVFRSPVSYNLIIGFHVWFAGLGAYLLARKLHMSNIAAWIVAVSAMFGAPLMARVAAGHPSHLFGRSLMIWALVAILQLAEAPSGWSALGLGGVYGAQLVIGIGNYQTALYTAVLSVVFGTYALVHRVALRDRKRFLGWGIVACLAAVGLGACRAGPTLEIGLQSTRQVGLSTASLNYGALPPIMLTGYLLPHTFDDPSILDYTWPEFALYVGSAPFVMALLAARRRWREPAVRWWIAITVLFLLLSLGSQAGAFSVFVKSIPGYQLFRNPARHAMVAGLGMTILAGFGIDALTQSYGGAWERLRARAGRLWLAGMAIAVPALLLAATYPEAAGPSFQALPIRAVRGSVWFLAAVCLFYLTFRLHSARPALASSALLVGVVTLDLVLYASPQIHQGTRPVDLAYINPGNFPKGEGYAVAFLETEEVPDWGLVNVAAENGIRLLNVYTGVIPERMTGIINVLAGRPGSTPQEENTLALDRIARPDVLDYLGVRYLLVNPESRYDADPSLREDRDLGVVQSLENVDALPLAFVVERVTTVSSPRAALAYVEATHDMRQDPVVVEGSIDRIHACPSAPGQADRIADVHLEGGDLRLDVRTSRGGMLVINQTYQVGWRGWIDGNPTRVYPVNYRWMGMYLPCPGRYEIQLRYTPLSLNASVMLSLAMLLGVGLVSMVTLVRSRRRNIRSGEGRGDAKGVLTPREPTGPGLS